MDKLTLTSSMLQGKAQTGRPVSSASEALSARKAQEKQGVESGSNAIRDEVRLSSTALLEKISNIQSMLENIQNVSRVLATAADSVDTVIAKLEEAGGIAVQARNALRSGISGAASLENLSERFAVLLNDIDNLAQNTGFKGENLLNGDRLVFVVDADASSKYVVEGFKVASDALGVEPAIFNAVQGAEESLAAVNQAIDEVKAFRSQLSGDINEMNTRRDFSQATIDVLVASAQNPEPVGPLSNEAASLLALQTRQLLAGSEHTLASEAQRNLLQQF